MNLDLSSKSISEALRIFKSRRDALLFDDSNTFAHQLDRFIQFIEKNAMAQSVLNSIHAENVGCDEWIESLNNDRKVLAFPDDPDKELQLRYEIIKAAQTNDNIIFLLGLTQRANKTDDRVTVFRSLIIRPFVEDFGNRLAEVANLASPEARELQAVPLNRIPSKSETKIFLSHKSVDKPIVRKYFNALKEVGFNPWFDEPEMPAGANLERDIFKGFEESCAAVFFITDNFVDEQYLAAEIDYAVMQKRKKGKKFSIITLRYSDAAPVPGLLTPYIYKNISNDLEGIFEIVRALPVELGPVRWKKETVSL